MRAHACHLGDPLEAASHDEAITRLSRECAYGHWHRMLFVRFLAEAELLYAPEYKVAVSIEEVRELAREQGVSWELLASGWAARMLPQIFRENDPVFDIELPPETRQALETLLDNIPLRVFHADDSLGWVYQFWQADHKDEINASGEKIGAQELPAVTQLFTDAYMVHFLLHNTLGAWWAGKILERRPDLRRSAGSESELRQICAVGNIEWTYLRFARDADGLWQPAAGAFPGWPNKAKDLTLLDPCMGSGHFLVFALPILAAFRKEEEGLSLRDAVCAVMKENVHGLELDPRCTQIAAFNLAFAAWRKIGYCRLPSLNLACSGQFIGITEAEWLRLAQRARTDLQSQAGTGSESPVYSRVTDASFRSGLTELYKLFEKAPTLGSLIDPHRQGEEIFQADFRSIESVFAELLREVDDVETHEMAITAQGMAKAAQLLAQQCTLVITNVPFLGRVGHDPVLRNYLQARFADAKTNLATAMLRRCIDFTQSGGTAAAVTPQGWLFQGSYGKLRQSLLATTHLNAVASLGPRAFEAISGHVVNVALIVLTNVRADLDSRFAGIDAHAGVSVSEKANDLLNGSIAQPAQVSQSENPDHRITVSEVDSGPLLQRYAVALQGTATADGKRFICRFWELPALGECWSPQATTVKRTMDFGALENILLWEKGQGALAKSPKAGVSGLGALGKPGIVVSQMGQLPVTRFLGTHFDNNCAALIPQDPDHLPAIWAFCSSPDYHQAVRRIDQKMKVTNATLAKVPFDLEHWQSVADGRYPSGLPRPCSSDPKQGIFCGHPEGSEAPLQVAVARLLGYRWPRQTGTEYMDCPALPPDGLECHGDDDGIVCLSAIKGELPAHERLLDLLAHAYGSDWSAALLTTLLSNVGYGHQGLDAWLRDGFFRQHCKLFDQTPFIWHIWDGRKDGFHALVNYHCLAAPDGVGRRTLERLTYSYLGPWIDRQRAEQEQGIEGADARLAYAEHLKNLLEQILEGEPQFDIFVRWKPLSNQPEGWEPDVNDGVRVNIRPFMKARPLGAKAKRACILRVSPNVSWNKDRGKEIERERSEYPWFWGCRPASQDFMGGEAFDGNRWNDLHYTNACKSEARARVRNASVA